MRATTNPRSDMQSWADPNATPDLHLVCDQPMRWLTTNGRAHWAKDDPVRRYWRDMGVTLTRQALKGRTFERVQVVFTIHRADKRSFDPGNFLTSKHFLDGMVDAGMVPDDNFRHVVGPDHRYGEPGKRRFEVRVYDLGGAS